MGVLMGCQSVNSRCGFTADGIGNGGNGMIMTHMVVMVAGQSMKPEVVLLL